MIIHQSKKRFPNAMWDVRHTFLQEQAEKGRLVSPIHDGPEINCLLSPVDEHEVP
jgi:hypothetical protein